MHFLFIVGAILVWSTWMNLAVLAPDINMLSVQGSNSCDGI
jgi:hypothetical protein